MDTNRRFPLLLSSFWIKIIALVTMTFDHIGYLFLEGTTLDVFRHIGRLAFPLFCFMVLEGVMHTKSFKKYALRLGIMASVISLAIILDEIFEISGSSLRNEGNIFIDLLLGALAVYCLKQEKWYFKIIAIVPLGLSIASFISSAIEGCHCYGDILWYPFFLRSQYGYLGVLMIILFYVAHLLKDAFVKIHSGITGIDSINYKDTNLERNILNIFSVMMIVVASVIYYVVGELMPAKYVNWMNDIQLFAIFSGVFVLLYNGKRGYNRKWFQYGSYLYYPLHMVILYLIYMMMFVS